MNSRFGASTSFKTALRVKQLLNAINQVAEYYHRLALVVAPSGSGKSAALREVADQLPGRYINVSLELSQRLLDLTVQQRAVKASQLLGEIAVASAEQFVLLDNLELLFDVSLKQDPLRLLQGISRHRIVVASWNGMVEDGFLTYARPGHPEYRSYQSLGLTTISLI